ncbi:MAG: aspartate kinase, partial [Algicola sp.]|nr:aspartate kinase [Algicola sp.]
MQVDVLKFGGSSFVDADSYQSVAAYLVKRLRRDGHKLLVVVSGMNGVTGQLKQLGLSVNANIEQRT